MSNQDPILGEFFYTEHGTSMRGTIRGGLHYIRGNKSPYFTLTADTYEKTGNNRWRESGGGCQHELILKHRPKLKPLADLHLSDINGAPSYAVENGWYWLAGALGGAGEKYHGGTGYPTRTPDECLQVFAEHVRIPLEDARKMRDSKPTKVSFSEWCETQRKRWKQEADLCVASLGLVVFGDCGRMSAEEWRTREVLAHV